MFNVDVEDEHGNTRRSQKIAAVVRRQRKVNLKSQMMRRSGQRLHKASMEVRQSSF